MTENVEKLNDAPSRAPVAQRVRPVKAPGPIGRIGATVTATIDNQEIKVPFGTTILEAARKLNIRIPTLCYHEDLCVAGVCRICVVEIEGQRTLQASCSYPITAPIVVHTHTRKVRRARRHIMPILTGYTTRITTVTSGLIEIESHLHCSSPFILGFLNLD